MTINENKPFVRLLKELGLYNIWMKERKKYINTSDCEVKYLYPVYYSFKLCIGDSFKWSGTMHFSLWASMGRKINELCYKHKIQLKETCKDILNDEDILNGLKTYVNNYFTVFNKTHKQYEELYND